MPVMDANPSYHIRGLKLNHDALKSYSIDNDSSQHVLEPIGKLNIFIGTNNSGKSRLLRSLLTHSSPPYLPTAFDYENIQKESLGFKRELQKRFDDSGIKEITASVGGPSLIQSFNSTNSVGK